VDGRELGGVLWLRRLCGGLRGYDESRLGS